MTQEVKEEVLIYSHQDPVFKATQISLASTLPHKVDSLCLLAIAKDGLLNDKLRRSACIYGSYVFMTLQLEAYGLQGLFF